MIIRIIAFVFTFVCLTSCAIGRTDPAPMPPAMYYDVDFQPVFAGKMPVKSNIAQVLV